MKPIRLVTGFLTVGVWTLLSRVFGFARDVMIAAFLGAIVFLTAGVSASADDAPRFNLGCSMGPCMVKPWDGPAKPPEFLNNGRALDHPRQGLNFLERIPFNLALNAYPDAASCVLQSEADANGVDLLTFDWADQRGQAQLKVCLSHIHNVIGDPEISAQWFEHYGFNVFSETKPAGHLREGWTVIHLNWINGAEFPAPYVTPSPTRLFFGSGFTMGVRLNASNVVQNVSIGFNFN